MVSAYLDAAILWRDDRWCAFALKTLERVWSEMYRADAGLFHFCREDGASQLANQLSDLAHTTRAFLDTYQVTGDNAHLLNELVTVHIVGAVDDARTRALHAAALAEYAPAKIVQLLDPARNAARLAQLGYLVRDAPRAYVCVGQECLAPVSEVEGIRAGIRKVVK